MHHEWPDQATLDRLAYIILITVTFIITLASFVFIFVSVLPLSSSKYSDRGCALVAFISAVYPGCLARSNQGPGSVFEREF